MGSKESALTPWRSLSIEYGESLSWIGKAFIQGKTNIQFLEGLMMDKLLHPIMTSNFLIWNQTQSQLIEEEGRMHEADFGVSSKQYLEQSSCEWSLDKICPQISSVAQLQCTCQQINAMFHILVGHDWVWIIITYGVKQWMDTSLCNKNKRKSDALNVHECRQYGPKIILSGLNASF